MALRRSRDHCVHLEMDEESPEATDYSRLCVAPSMNFEQALAKDKRLPPVHELMLGTCYFRTRRFFDAATRYQCALAVAQTASLLGQDIYLASAASYRRAGERRKAIEVLRGCLEEFPGEGGPYFQLAEIRVEEAEYDAAY